MTTEEHPILKFADGWFWSDANYWYGPFTSEEEARAAREITHAAG